VDVSEEEEDEEESSEEEETKEAIKAKTRKLADKHKSDLEKLKESDPEFFKYLQENDKQLLEFDISESEEEEEDEGEEGEEDDEEMEEGEEEEEEEEPDREVTKAMLAQWESAIVNASIPHIIREMMINRNDRNILLALVDN
jgi:nucleolar complex protein 2